MYHSFIVYKKFYYLKWAVLLTAICVGLYLWHEPPSVPNGGSALGYLLGSIGAALIGWLSWFGVRKRSYHSTTGNVQGWLSAHVYFGCALFVIATLHTGFQFGWNIHTLAYVLMVVVIVSGFVGVVLYRLCPRMMSEALQQASRREILEELNETTANILRLADEVEGDVHDRVLRENQDATVGILAAASREDSGAQAYTGNKHSRKTGIRNSDDLSDHLYRELSGTQSPEAANTIRALLSQLAHKRELTGRIGREAALKNLLTIWLFIHVPMSIALIAALIIHVVAVFAYW